VPVRPWELSGRSIPHLHVISRMVPNLDNDTDQARLESYLNTKRVRLFKGPPNSGDLRPIETCIARMKRKLIDGDPGPDESEAQWRNRMCGG